MTWKGFIGGVILGIAMIFGVQYYDRQRSLELVSQPPTVPCIPLEVDDVTRMRVLGHSLDRVVMSLKKQIAGGQPLISAFNFGIPMCLAAILDEETNQTFIFANPEVIFGTETEWVTANEWNMLYPKRSPEPRKRAWTIELTFLDVKDGFYYRRMFKGNSAVVIQHVVDILHLVFVPRKQ